jgi:hypothetical protein
LQRGDWHFGHRYGREHRRLLQEANIRGMRTQGQFDAWVRSNAQWYQVQGAAENLSHAYEKTGSALSWHRVVGHDALAEMGVGGMLTGSFHAAGRCRN